MSMLTLPAQRTLAPVYARAGARVGARAGDFVIHRVTDHGAAACDTMAVPRSGEWVANLGALARTGWCPADACWGPL